MKIRLAAGLRPDRLGAPQTRIAAIEGVLLLKEDISIDWPQDGTTSLKYKAQLNENAEFPIIPIFF